jgi:holo-[acyl-carrier protein] synthase
MIIGLGIDLVFIPRIEEAFIKWEDRFLKRVFTSEEIDYCLRQKRPALPLALRFAAKEASSKALGTGMRQGVSWSDISVIHEPSGRPILKLYGNALKKAMELGGASWHVSLSHEKDYAVAVVIIEGKV